MLLPSPAVLVLSIYRISDAMIDGRDPRIPLSCGIDRSRLLLLFLEDWVLLRNGVMSWSVRVYWYRNRHVLLLWLDSLSNGSLGSSLLFLSVSRVLFLITVRVLGALATTRHQESPVSSVFLTIFLGSSLRIPLPRLGGLFRSLGSSYGVFRTFLFSS
jgi:hypothetical protein